MIPENARRKKGRNIAGDRRTRHYLRALHALGLSPPVVNIDHIPQGDEFDDCLTIAQWVDVIIHDQGRPIAVLMSVDRYQLRVGTRGLNSPLNQSPDHDA